MPDGREPDVKRLAVAVACLLALAGLVVGFGAYFEDSTAYPDAAAIDADYQDRVGERVHLWGSVVGERDGRVVFEAGEGDLRLLVSEPPPSTVDRGEQLQVVGTLGPDRTFETEAYDTQSSDALARTYLLSVVGGLVAAGAFLRRWRVETDGWRFVPR